MDEEWIKVGTVNLQPPKARALLLHLKNQVDVARLQFSRIREDRTKFDDFLRMDKEYSELLRQLQGAEREATWLKVIDAFNDWTRHHAILHTDTQFLIIALARIQLIFEKLKNLLQNQELDTVYLKHEKWLCDWNFARNIMEHMEKEIANGLVDLGPYAIGIGYEFTADRQKIPLTDNTEKELNQLFDDIISVLIKK